MIINNTKKTTKIIKLKDVETSEDVVLGYGHFNTVHHGHIRYLKYAKKQGKTLFLAIIPDTLENGKQRFPYSQNERADSLKLLGLVDYLVLLEKDNLFEAIKLINPKKLILGTEYKSNKDFYIKKAISYMKSIKREVRFYAGEIHYNSSDLLNESETELSKKRKDQFKEACKRQDLSLNNLISSIQNFKKANILVIGDVIIDQYIACEALGMSAEAPVIVVKELESKKFLGGAGVVASHVKSLGASCNLITLAGEDDNAAWVRNSINEKKIGDGIVYDSTRPTTFKKRYVVDNQKLFRVSKLEDHQISKQVEDEIINKIIQFSKKCNGIIISDFVYGLITQKILKTIREVSKSQNIPVFGDVQCSSQVGLITKLEGCTFLFPNEREARIALQDKETGLEILSQSLMKKTNSKNLVMKLGSDGFIVYKNNPKGNYISQAFPALSVNPLDVTGAGDSLLAIVSVGISSGNTTMETAALGCCASSIAVQNMGNKPIEIDEIKQKLILSLS